MINTLMELNPLQLTFYSAALLAIVASLKVVTGKNTVYALLYLVVSLLAVAVCFYLMGAPFAAGLEVIVYAGAILVLFVFAIMMFGLGQDETLHAPSVNGGVGNSSDGSVGGNINVSKVNQFTLWFGPFFLAFLLLIELVFAINSGEIQARLTANTIDAKQVGFLLYGPYVLAVEIASFLLLAGLIGGYHFAKPEGVGLDRKNDLGEHG